MLRNGLYGGSFLSSEFGPGKAAIKADICRPEQQEQMNNREKARRQGVALGTHLLLHTLQRNIGTFTPAKCGQWYRPFRINDCMKVQLIVRLYANCIIVCLKYAVDCQSMQ